MDLVTMGVTSGVVVVGGVVFYLKSIKYFTPSEVVVIPIPPVTLLDDEGNPRLDDEGNPLRTNYRIIAMEDMFFYLFGRNIMCYL